MLSFSYGIFVFPVVLSEQILSFKPHLICNKENATDFEQSIILLCDKALMQRPSTSTFFSFLKNFLIWLTLNYAKKL